MVTVKIPTKYYRDKVTTHGYREITTNEYRDIVRVKAMRPSHKVTVNVTTQGHTEKVTQGQSDEVTTEGHCDTDLDPQPPTGTCPPGRAQTGPGPAA